MPAPASATSRVPASSARPNTGPALFNGWTVAESAAAERDSTTANAPASTQRVEGRRASIGTSVIAVQNEATPSRAPPDEAERILSMRDGAKTVYFAAFKTGHCQEPPTVTKAPSHRLTCWRVGSGAQPGARRCALGTALDAQDGALDVVKVRRNFYMIAGAGGNIGVQVGSDGIVLVNAGTAQAVRSGPGGAEEADRPADPLHHQRRRRPRLRRRQREIGQGRLHHLHQCAGQHRLRRGDDQRRRRRDPGA